MLGVVAPIYECAILREIQLSRTVGRASAQHIFQNRCRCASSFQPLGIERHAEQSALMDINQVTAVKITAEIPALATILTFPVFSETAAMPALSKSPTIPAVTMAVSERGRTCGQR